MYQNPQPTSPKSNPAKAIIELETRMTEAYSPTCKTLRHNMFANMHLVSCFLDFSINHLIKPTNNGPDCFMGGRADISAVGSFFEVHGNSWEIFGVEKLPPRQKPSHKELLLLIGLGVDDMRRITWIYIKWLSRLVDVLGSNGHVKPCPWNQKAEIFQGF